MQILLSGHSCLQRLEKVFKFRANMTPCPSRVKLPLSEDVKAQTCTDRNLEEECWPLLWEADRITMVAAPS